MANENNADYLDDFELDEPEGISNAASAPAETPIFERPARPRKTAEPINEMTETGSIDAVYVSDSDYSGKGLSDSSYRRAAICITASTSRSPRAAATSSAARSAGTTSARSSPWSSCSPPSRQPPTSA